MSCCGNGPIDYVDLCVCVCVCVYTPRALHHTHACVQDTDLYSMTGCCGNWAFSKMYLLCADEHSSYFLISGFFFCLQPPGMGRDDRREQPGAKFPC